MPPDAAWPNLPAYGPFTKADHAAHTSPKGIPYPGDLVPGTHSHKMAKLAMKFTHKPHLKFPVKTSPRRGPRRKKKDKA